MYPRSRGLDRLHGRPAHPSTFEVPIIGSGHDHGACEYTRLGLATGVPFTRSPVTLSRIFGSNIKADWDYRSSALTTNYQDGAGERLTNGDFETGSPPSSWSAWSGATLSAVAGARTGGSGTQYLRVTNTAPDAVSGALQAALVVGASYWATGWARGDGSTALPRFADAGANHFEGTTSATWQQFSVIFTAAGTDVMLRAYEAAPASGHADFDDVSLIELPGIVTCPNALNSGTYDMTNATAASQLVRHPTAWNGGPCARGIGAHWHSADTMAALYTGSDQPWFGLFVVELTSTGQLGFLCNMGSSSSTTPRDDVRETGGAQWSHRRSDDAASAVDNAVTGSTDTSKHVVAVMHTGTVVTVWLDGVVTSVSSAASNVGAMTVDQLTLFALRHTGVANQLDANLVRAAMGTTATAQQMVAASYLLMQQHGV